MKYSFRTHFDIGIAARKPDFVECEQQQQRITWADPEGGGGKGLDPPPLKNHKNIGFLSNTGPDPLYRLKATKPVFNVWPSSPRQRNAI